MVALILSIALEFGLPPYFVLSIAYTENPQLVTTAVNKNVNGSSDKGLMQLNDCWFTTLDWADPETNIRAACGHIKWLRSEGLNWWQVAIAYNGGITGLRKGPSHKALRYADMVFDKWRELEPRGAHIGGR